MPILRRVFFTMTMPTGVLVCLAIAVGLLTRLAGKETRAGWLCLLIMLGGLLSAAVVPPGIAVSLATARGRCVRFPSVAGLCAAGWAANFVTMWIGSAIASRCIPLHGIC